MTNSEEGVIVAVITVLLAIIVLITSVIIYITLRAKRRNQKATKSLKSRKPSLKLDIKKSDLPILVEEAPSPAYKILSDRQQEELQNAGFPFPALGAPVPKTPDTPGFISQTPGFIPENTGKEATSPVYGRSISVPGDSFLRTKRSGEESPTGLWKTAVHKAARLNVFDVSPRKSNRISICRNGKIKFSLVSNSQLRELQVRVLDLIDLPLKKESGMSFPFIKIFFLLEGSATDSDLIEILSFPKDNSCTFTAPCYDTLRKSTLKFLVLEYDKFSRTEFMAEAVAELQHVDLDGAIESRHLMVNQMLEDKQIGLLMVSLCYQPNQNKMSMVVLKASDLPSTEGNNNPDYFVKITLLHKNEIKDKRRTKVAKKCTCPVFNERLTFPCEEATVKDISFVFDVVRYESRLRHEKNQSIGSVVLGNSYSGRTIYPLELYHFREMLNSPLKQITEWHRLVPCK